MYRFIGIGSLAVIIALGVYFNVPNIQTNAISQIAPEFVSISGYINTPPISLANQHGKAVFLHFWRTSCENCVADIPFLNQMYTKYHNYGLQVISIHAPIYQYEQDKTFVQNFVTQNNIKYPVLLDNSRNTFNLYGDAYYPRDAIVDSKGYIISTHIGAGDNYNREQAIRMALAMRNSMNHKQQIAITAIIVAVGGLGIVFLLIPSVVPQAACQIYTVCYSTPTQNYYDGILQFYQHKPGGAIWNLEGEQNLAACPYNSGCKVVAIGGGWYKNEGPQNNIRNEVPSDPSYLNRKPAVHLGGMGPYDQNVWRNAGYMDTPKDWKNMEVSALFYLPPGTTKDVNSFGPAGVDYVLRGGVNEDNYPFTCLAQNYHVGVFTSDHGAKIERDIEHTSGYNAGQLTGDKLSSSPIELPIGRVFGFKVVIYNSQDNQKVRIDAYLDTTGSGNKWNLIYSFVDDGHTILDSVRGQTHCPGLRADLPVTFGGPLSGLRLNWSGAMWRQFTMVEIIQPRF